MLKVPFECPAPSVTQQVIWIEVGIWTAVDGLAVMFTRALPFRVLLTTPSRRIVPVAVWPCASWAVLTVKLRSAIGVTVTLVEAGEPTGF